MSLTRLGRPFGAVLAVVVAVTATACSAPGTETVDKQEELTSIAENHAREPHEFLVGEGLDDFLVIEFGQSAHIELTDDLDRHTPDIERLLLGIQEEHRDWQPAIDIKVDNARFVNETYLCMDVEVTNNMPALSLYQTKKRAWLSPTAALSRKPGVWLGGIIQLADGEGVDREKPVTMGRAGTVETGIPGFEYVDGTAKKGSDGALFAEPTKTLTGGGNQPTPSDFADDSVNEGLTTMRPGGTLEMTRCWWRGGNSSVYLESKEEMKAPVSYQTGAFVVNMTVEMAGRSVEVLVPFGLAD